MQWDSMASRLRRRITLSSGIKDNGAYGTDEQPSEGLIGVGLGRVALPHHSMQHLRDTLGLDCPIMSVHSTQAAPESSNA